MGLAASAFAVMTAPVTIVAFAGATVAAGGVVALSGERRRVGIRRKERTREWVTGPLPGLTDKRSEEEKGKLINDRFNSD
jgi:hypothetical protein